MGKRWKQGDLDKLPPGMVPGAAPKTSKRKRKPAIPKPPPKALAEIKTWLQVLKIEFVTEYKFHHKRRFRFDIAILEHKIAIEYEGVVSETSRHTTIGGYTNDATKYNLAQQDGWKILRYTVANYNNFLSDITNLISNGQT